MMLGYYLHGEELLLMYAVFLIVAAAGLIFAIYAIYKLLRNRKGPR